MSKIEPLKNRVIQIKEGIAGPVMPLEKNVNQRKIGDYPNFPKVYHEVAQNYTSTSLIGPPICDEFMALIQDSFYQHLLFLVLLFFWRKTFY